MGRMANPAEWGPPMWRILHTFAERLGKQTHPITISDEKRAWTMLLKSTESVLPCAKCKAHFQSWRKRNPIEASVALDGEPLRIWARQWVYYLHDEVNQEKGVTSPGLEEVQQLFQSRTAREQTDDIREINAHLLKASQSRIIAGEHIHTFKTNMSLIGRLC